MKPSAVASRMADSEQGAEAVAETDSKALG